MKSHDNRLEQLTRGRYINDGIYIKLIKLTTFAGYDGYKMQLIKDLDSVIETLVFETEFYASGIPGAIELARLEALDFLGSISDRLRSMSL